MNEHFPQPLYWDPCFGKAYVVSKTVDFGGGVLFGTQRVTERFPPGCSHATPRTKGQWCQGRTRVPSTRASQDLSPGMGTLPAPLRDRGISSGTKRRAFMGDLLSPQFSPHLLPTMQANTLQEIENLETMVPAEKVKTCHEGARRMRETKYLSHCYGLNWVPPSSYVEAQTPNVMVLGSGVFRR